MYLNELPRESFLSWLNSKKESLQIAQHGRIWPANMSIEQTSSMVIHPHMAKTGDTSLYGMLVNTFERVCGHK